MAGIVIDNFNTKHFSKESKFRKDATVEDFFEIFGRELKKK
ncbi:MAG: hypothetical protein ACR5KV_03690 [Wolbachia sp.]